MISKKPDSRSSFGPHPKTISEVVNSRPANKKPHDKPLSKEGTIFTSENPDKNPVLNERVLTEQKKKVTVGRIASGAHHKTKQLSRRTLKALTKYKPRRLISVSRVHKYGFINFTRNAWLSLASIVIMIITLLIMSVAVLTWRIANDTVESIKADVDMSIYFKQDTPTAAINEILTDLKALSSVKPDGVKFTSSADARREYIEEHLNDQAAMAAINEAENMFPNIINVQVVDINDTSQLEEFVRTNSTASNNLDPLRLPSFASDRRAAIDKIARTAGAVQIAILVAGVIFVAIAILVIFNTIRMSIFSRQDELYMMSLIGASKSFIRGPFIVEAAVCGLIAAVLTGLILLSFLPKILTTLANLEITAEPTFNWIWTHLALTLGGLYLIGTLLGALAAFFATKRYLK